MKRWKDGKTGASCSASAVSLKLFKFVHHILLPLFSAANCSFEPTCHSAGRSTSVRFQTSLRWANIHAACPCSAYCLGTQTGHKQDNLIVPCCVPHGSVLSGFADGGLSGVLPPDLLTWWQPGGFMKLQLTWSTPLQSTDYTLDILMIITGWGMNSRCAQQYRYTRTPLQSHIKIYKGLMMKHMQCNQEIVALHKRRVQSVAAWSCDLLEGALTGGTDKAVELLPLQSWVSRSPHQVIPRCQIKIKITLVHPLVVTCQNTTYVCFT